MTHDVGGSESELREAAIRSLRKKRDFRTHLLAYFLVNGMLIVIWAVTGADFFWPVFPLAGWGIAVVFNAWDVYGRPPITEQEIQREQERLRSS
jgi:uncharacterized membrane protein